MQAMTTIPEPRVEDDGRRDFDFLLASWRVHNRRLRRPLAGSTEWEEFEASLSARPILGGLGHLDEFWVPALPDGGSLHGCALRLFDPQTRSWSDWWTSTSRSGHLDSPAVGGFDGGHGTFLGDMVLDGRPLRVRYRWSEVSPTSARWEQAFSPDDGGSWETNWVMTMSRVASA
jgi:hypothetical protein